MKKLITICLLATMLLCSCGSKSTKESQSKITAEMALEGVSNYCQSEYDWSMAKDNRLQTESHPSLLEDGRGAKEEGEANPDIMVESVPALNVEEETGTINLFNYLDKNE